jgi:hypothetical protein
VERSTHHDHSLFFGFRRSWNDVRGTVVNISRKHPCWHRTSELSCGPFTVGAAPNQFLCSLRCGVLGRCRCPVSRDSSARDRRPSLTLDGGWEPRSEITSRSSRAVYSEVTWLNRTFGKRTGWEKQIRATRYSLFGIVSATCALLFENSTDSGGEAIRIGCYLLTGPKPEESYAAASASKRCEKEKAEQGVEEPAAHRSANVGAAAMWTVAWHGSLS